MRTLSWVSAEKTASSRELALGYLRVPAELAAREVALAHQALQIDQACRGRGLGLGELVSDLYAADGPDEERPALRTALERIAAGHASALVVAGLDQLGRSASSLGTLLRWFESREARLIAADLDLDTATPEGRVAARALVAAGELEHAKLGERTRRGLAAARERGANPGRPAVADRPRLRAQIERWRGSGMTLQAIADRLNEERVPTLRGGKEWRPSSVQAAAGYKRPGRGPRLPHLPDDNGQNALAE